MRSSRSSRTSSTASRPTISWRRARPPPERPPPLTATAKAPSLSAIVLCYQEGEQILEVIRPLYERLAGSGIDFELILVANFHAGEADPTPAVARRFAADRDRVVVIADAKQGAMGWDMRAGFAAAANDHLVVIDGDGQNPIEDVVRIHEALIETGADIAKGTRAIRYDGLWRSFTSRGYNLLFQRLFPLKGVSDVNGKPKGLTRAAYERLDLVSDDWFIDAEIVIKARRLGLRITELPVIYGANQHRHSLVRPSTVGEFLRNFWVYRSREPSSEDGAGNSSRTM